MEVGSSLQQQQHLGDSFSYGWLTQAPPPSLDHLAADAGHPFGSSRSYFIDMDDADLFSMRWTTTPPTQGSDFDFGLLPVPGSPTQLASASRIFRRGRLLPSDPGVAAQEQEQGDGVVPGAPWTAPLFRSAQSAPVSPSWSSSATGRHAAMRGGRRGGSSTSAWKLVVLRFLLPLYRKARALAAAPRHRHTHYRVAPAAASPGRGSSASVEWCHGSADTAVNDAILYCKKSSGQDALP